jgi:hypothetical protein
MKQLFHALKLMGYAAPFAAALMLLSGTASALHKVTYDVTRCQGVTDSLDQGIERFSGGITVSSNTEIICPIVKHTSGPGLKNDRIISVDVPVAFGKVDCTLSIYEVKPGQQQRVLENRQNFFNGYYSVLTMGSYTSGYWLNSNSWLYAQMHCNIGGGARMFNYSVSEDGTAQSGKRIVSAAGCDQFPVAPAYSFYGGNTWSSSGFVQVSGDEQDFRMVCGLPTGAARYVQIALGPHIDSANTTDQMGCSIQGRNNSWQYIGPRPVGQSEFVPQMLTFTQTTPTNLICQVRNQPINGDAKIFSYRSSGNGF